MTICVIGTGFVGVVSAAVYASFGNTVFGLDIDPEKIEKLRQGVVPFYEPQLSELLIEQQKGGQLFFTTEYAQAVSEADAIIIAVGTPSSADGEVDLRYIHAAATQLAPHLKRQAIVAVKSTVPPGSFTRLQEIIASVSPHQEFSLASLPEFLREGTAVADTLHPDRIVIGATDAHVFQTLEELHAPLGAPIVKLSPESAQMAKYTANAYLATRITFINQIADLCDKNGADIQDVIRAIGYDKRIGPHYWYPGMGYGGSCFPKDVKELAAYSRSVGLDENLLNHINRLNDERIPLMLERFGSYMDGWENKRVAVLGLAFKPHTDDIREAPSMKVLPYLDQAGAVVSGYDPKANEHVHRALPTLTRVTYVADINTALNGADAILSLIEWPEIITHDFPAIQAGKKCYLFDVRNQFDRTSMEALGYTYYGVGR